MSINKLSTILRNFTVQQIFFVFQNFIIFIYLFIFTKTITLQICLIDIDMIFS